MSLRDRDYKLAVKLGIIDENIKDNKCQYAEENCQCDDEAHKYEVSILGSDPFYSRDDIHIKEENILNIKTVAYAELLDYSKYSFFELSKKLSADDFIDFCKDHDVSLVNIFGGQVK